MQYIFLQTFINTPQLHLTSALMYHTLCALLGIFIAYNINLITVLCAIILQPLCCVQFLNVPHWVAAAPADEDWVGSLWRSTAGRGGGVVVAQACVGETVWGHWLLYRSLHPRPLLLPLPLHASQFLIPPPASTIPFFGKGICICSLLDWLTKKLFWLLVKLLFGSITQHLLAPFLLQAYPSSVYLFPVTHAPSVSFIILSGTKLRNCTLSNKPYVPSVRTHQTAFAQRWLCFRNSRFEQNADFTWAQFTRILKPNWFPLLEHSAHKVKRSPFLAPNCRLKVWERSSTQSCTKLHIITLSIWLDWTTFSP